MSGESFQIPGLGQLPSANPTIPPDVAIAAQYALADQKKLAELAAKDNTADSMNEGPAPEKPPTEPNSATVSTQNGAGIEKDNEAVTEGAMGIESGANVTDAANTDPITVVAEKLPEVENSNEGIVTGAMEVESNAKPTEAPGANQGVQNNKEGATKDAMEIESEASPTEGVKTDPAAEVLATRAAGQESPNSQTGNDLNTKDTIKIESEVNSSHSGTADQAMEDVSADTIGQGAQGGDIISTLDAALALEDVSQGVEAEHPEWEVDSSPYESSSEDSSDDSSDDDSDDGDHPILGIEETVRLLMAEDDGDGDGARQGRGPAPLRTKNELAEEPLPKPDVTITPQMKIELIGHVASVVETTMVIESLKNGETQVLNIGSVLCKEDRTVVGALADTFGPVREPRYLVFFDKQEEIKDLGLEKGTPIYYSVAHADYIFTQALKQEKGTDASNLHDEELAPEDMEFSDDEKEAAYKRSLKAKKKGAKGKGGRGREQNPTADVEQSELKYDEDEDGPYKPLTRPEVFAQGVPLSLPPRPPAGYAAARPIATPGANRGRGPRGGHRGGHHRGRGGHGGRGGSSNYVSAQAAPQAPPMVQPPPTGHGFVPPPPPGWTGQPAFPTPPAPFPQPLHGHPHQIPSAPFNFAYQGWNQGQQGVPHPPAPASGYSQGWQAPASGSAPLTAYGNPAYYQGNAHNQQTPGQGQPPAYWPHGQPPT